MSQPLYDTSMRRLDEQFGRIDAIERKAIAVLTFGSAILPISIALINSDRQLTSFQKYSVSFALVLLALIAVCAILVIRTSKWSIRPDLLTLLKNSEEGDEDDLKYWIATECIRSINTNDPGLAQMARWYQRETLFFVIAIIDLVGCATTIIL